MIWKMVERETGLIEWRCEHGVGHPDHSSVMRMNKLTGQDCWGIHGCDSCCHRDDFPGKKKKGLD